jgi:hypothetical protein
MKKNVLVALIVLITMDLFAQIGKGKIMVSIDGNYLKTTTENGVTTNQNIDKIKQLNVGSSIGYFIADNFIAGAGLDYFWSKESRKSEMLMNYTFSTEFMDIESNAILPYVYLGYYLPITEKLYFNTNFKFSYGKVKSDFGTVVIQISRNENTNTNTFYDKPLSYIGSFGGDSDMDLFGAKLFPELTYFIRPNYGLCIGLGGIEYSLPDWETEDSSWSVNFNPVYWKFGIKMKL